jgi:antitoxin ParD1/3/4
MMQQAVEVVLPPDLRSAIDDAVARGDYPSANEVIRDAVAEWSARRWEDEIPVERLRELVQEGLDSGPGRFNSIDEIIAEARRRFEER